MSATKRHARIDRRRTVCPNGAHTFLAPILRQRPVVVFCVQCQAAKDIPR